MSSFNTQRRPTDAVNQAKPKKEQKREQEGGCRETSVKKTNFDEGEAVVLRVESGIQSSSHPERWDGTTLRKSPS
ncbi:hypothetical protein LX36DRAFT_292207 [Colletotrichum falcatum]|nr:hypothetical protein LX36DRAFT_292207 [Colletotrichum falcatum]